MLRIFIVISLFMHCIYANTLRIAVSQNVGVLNPQGYNLNQMYAQNMLYEGLVKVDKKGNIVPSLATSWSIDKALKIYRFILRKNVKFSNGEGFNANAVVKNFQSIMKNRIRHSWSVLATLLDKVEAINDYEVIIILKRPYIATLQELALVRPYRFLAPSMIPSDLNLVSNNPKKPIGTGPYMLVDTKLGTSDIFIKNPYYWDKDSYKGIYFDKVVTKVIIEPNSKIMALMAKQVDLIYGYDEIPIEIFKSISNNTDFTTYISKPIFTRSLVLNSSHKILKSNLIRNAIYMGIDKKVLIKSVYYNYQDIADTLFYKNMPYSNINYVSPSFDTKKAMDIIQKQGYTLGSDGYFYKDGKIFNLDLMFIANNPAQKTMAQILQSQLKRIGIHIRLVGNEENIYRSKQLSGNFDLSFSQTWGLPYEPLTMLHSMLREGHVDHVLLMGLDNRDEVFQAIENLTSSDKLDKVAYVLKMLYDSNVYIPLTYESNKAVATNGIKGIDMGMCSFDIPFWEFYR